VRFSNSHNTHRHCEPTGRREAPPDDRLREAIHRQNNGDLGLLRRFAPRNDVDARPRSRGAIRPSFGKNVAPRKTEGAGKAGCPMHPQPRVRKVESTRASSPQVHRSNPAFPAQWFTAYFVLSPVTGLFCHRRIPGKFPQNLTPASGRQDHTTSPSALAPFVKGASASTASRPASVTIAIRPLWGGTVVDIEVIWVRTKQEYFCGRGWTAK
jgi:hypothetical protein